MIVETEQIKYVVPVTSKYTYIQGKSGSGKTALVNLLSLHELGSIAVKVTCDFPIHVLDPKEKYLPNIENHIIVIDENSLILNNMRFFSKQTKDSKNFFLICSRELAKDTIPLGLDSFYEIKYNGDGTDFICKIYNKNISNIKIINSNWC